MIVGYLRYTPIVEWSLGPLTVSPHGLGTALGFLAGARLLLVTTRRLDIADQLIHTALVRGAIGAVIGARVAYVVNPPGSFDSPLEWVQIWNGGISLLGGIAGGLALGLPVIRRAGIALWPVLDGVAPGLALGIAIGRVGDLIVADHPANRPDSPSVTYPRCRHRLPVAPRRWARPSTNPPSMT